MKRKYILCAIAGASLFPTFTLAQSPKAETPLQSSEPDKREANTLRPKQSVAPLPPAPPPPIPLPPPPPTIEPRKAMPRGNPVSWVTDLDYPTAMLSEEKEGVSKVTITVSPEGRVADCTAEGTARPILHQTACDVLKRRARFTPAVDANGTQVQGDWTYVYDWKYVYKWRVPPWAVQPD